jgi:hypothetical protein
MRRLLALGAVLCLSAFASTPAFAVTIHEHFLTTGNGDTHHVRPTPIRSAVKLLVAGRGTG